MFNIDQKLMYQAGQSITNIRTAKVKDSNDEFYITMADVRGFVHFLKGCSSEIESYLLFTKVQLHTPSNAP